MRSPLTTEGIKNTVKPLNANKSPRFDCIIFKITECNFIKILSQMIKPCNESLDSCISPETWSHELVLSRFKHRNKSKTTTFKVITISNSLSKLFSAYKQKRVRDLLEKEAYAGFQKKALELLVMSSFFSSFFFFLTN